MSQHAAEPDQDPAAWWQERYASGATRWSGRPNELLVGQAAGLVPGRALDLGCGTGGDAIWLASLGWQVTAVDIAAAALEQGAAHAAEAGLGAQITWERHDFEVSFPQGAFDLVSACYLQSPLPFARLAALRAAAAAVAPGGTLVVVAHETTPGGRPPGPGNYMPLVDELVDDLSLPPDSWTVEHAASVPRERTTDAGALLRYADHVVRARRR